MDDWVFHGVLPPPAPDEPQWLTGLRSEADPLRTAGNLVRSGAVPFAEAAQYIRGGDDLQLVRGWAARTDT